MPIICVDNLNDPRLAPFSHMTDAELRDPHQMVGLARALDAASDPNRLANGLFIGESRNVIERALHAGIRPFALLVEECWLASTAPLIDQLLEADPATPVFTATRDQMRELTGFERTRGALAAFLRPPLPRVEKLLAGARRVAILEDITNYTNIGAIFRSAAALGIDAVLVTPACHDPYYRRAARVSMGTVFQVPWTRIGHESPKKESKREEEDAGAERVSKDKAAHTEGAREHGKKIAGSARKEENAPTRSEREIERDPSTDDPAAKLRSASWADEGIPLLHALGFATCALALTDDSIPLQDKRLQSLDKIALVLGTEGDGLAARTIAACDYTVRIPMDHDVDSLNVAAASAVAFWELRTHHRD